MTIPEEIEQLKARLAQTSDEQAEAELILELSNKYASISSADSKPYIDRLLQIAEKMKSAHYKAWGLYYLAVINRFWGKYTAAINFGQQAISLFEQAKNIKGVAIAFNNMGGIHYNKGNYPEALKNYLKSLQISEEIGDKKGIASSYNNVGLIQHQQGNYTEALKNYLLALRIRKEMDEKVMIAYSYNNIGSVYSDQGNYPEALKNHLRSLRIREEIGDHGEIAASYGNIGIIHGYAVNYPEALKNLFRALQIREELGDKRGTAVQYNNIGEIYDRQKNYPEAFKYFFQALQIWEELGEQPGIASTHCNIGHIHECQGNYPEALRNHLLALQISQEIDDKYITCFCYNSIGVIHEKQADYTEALKNQLLAFQLAGEINNKDLIKRFSFSLSNSYKAAGDFENALKYHEKYHQVESEMLGEQAQKQLTNLNFRHNTEQKEKEAEINRLRNVELKGALDHLQVEKDRSENLLLNILPSEVAEELKEKGTSEAKLFEDVTVLFTDFKGFTTVSERLTPQELVNELHSCFKAFDEIVGKYIIEKIKTVGDAYLAASGLPVANANHAEDMIKAAFEIRDFMLNRRKKLGNKTFEMRIGLHSGKVVAGIVGVKKFAYDIWGDTVNTAARMEQNGEAGKVNISEATYELVKDKFNCEYRGEIEAKNKGKLKMYFVE